MSRTPTLLIVDDEKATREGLRLALEDDFDVFAMFFFVINISIFVLWKYLNRE
jgi:hypothetical protein